MPELPEVETWRRLADRAATGKTILKVQAQPDLKIFDRNDPAQLAKQLIGRTVMGTHRAGKHLWLRLEPREDLYIHFGMTGSLWWLQPDGPAPATSNWNLRWRTAAACSIEICAGSVKFAC